MKTPKEIEAIEALAHAATEGPLELLASGWREGDVELKHLSCMVRGGSLYPEDAEFFGEAREHVLALCRDVNELRDTLQDESVAHDRVCNQYEREVEALARRAADAERQLGTLQLQLNRLHAEAWRVLNRAKALGYHSIVEQGSRFWFVHEPPCLGRDGLSAAATLQAHMCFELVVEALLAQNSFAGLFDDESPQEKPHTTQNQSLEWQPER